MALAYEPVTVHGGVRKPLRTPDFMVEAGDGQERFTIGPCHRVARRWLGQWRTPEDNWVGEGILVSRPRVIDFIRHATRIGFSVQLYTPIEPEFCLPPAAW